MGSRVYQTSRSDVVYTSEEDISLPNLEQLKQTTHQSLPKAVLWRHPD